MDPKKISAHLPPDMISSIKFEAARKGIMHFSDLVALKFMDILPDFKSIPSYQDLETKFKDVFAQFVPSKVGKRCPQPKKLVTLFLSGYIHSEISACAKKFSLSKSSLIELAVRLANRHINNGIPLFMKFYDSDISLLNELIQKTGASDVTEFLIACKYPWVIDAIRKEVVSMHNSN